MGFIILKIRTWQSRDYGQTNTMYVFVSTVISKFKEELEVFTRARWESIEGRPERHSFLEYKQTSKEFSLWSITVLDRTKNRN